MTDYKELVERLRTEQFTLEELSIILPKAADAIEELQETLEAVQKNSGINFRMWEEAQAEVERLKEGNEELRKRQTYIDRYGNEWLTSAEDVPNYAYEHGYADGLAEAEAQLPKLGKWVGVSPMVDTVQCSICGGQLFSSELETPYCPYCGADMIGEQNVE